VEQRPSAVHQEAGQREQTAPAAGIEAWLNFESKFDFFKTIIKYF
jgi:hypothetical protein